MAAPTGVLATFKNIIISIDNESLGVISTTPFYSVGTIELVGPQVESVAIGDIVMFELNKTFTQGNDTAWAVAKETDVLFTYTAAP